MYMYTPAMGDVQNVNKLYLVYNADFAHFTYKTG